VTHVSEHAVVSVAWLSAALILIAMASTACLAEDRDRISPSVEQQGVQISPIPFDKLNLKGRPRALVALGSYLVNGVGDCVGCHSFPRFLRPGGTVPGTNGNFTGNVTSQGSNPNFGNPFLDPPEQGVDKQLAANHNVKHFLAGGRCFGFFMSRNLTPDDSGKPRGLTEAEFIQVMRTGKDISCSKVSGPPVYGTIPDPVCTTPEAPGAGHTFNPEVLQSMPWPTFHSMIDTDLKAIYAYLSSLPQTTACNTVQNGCSGWFGDAAAVGAVGQNRYVSANTDDCPNNRAPGADFGAAPPQ